MSETVIQARDLGKLYRLGARRRAHDTLRDAVADWASSRLSRLTGGQRAEDAGQELWALRDVSFEVKRGEVLGVIGGNGAGKSTLLKILSRITEPTTGRIEFSGRVASLLEVGTGFHPELTGRENIFLNGAVLGMSRKEISRRFGEIVEFSGIEKFLDTPVKRYSSGMFVRLGFAVAAHLDPEIMLVDEVLAVGDAAFQKKCLGKMGDISRTGRTVLFVSHNMGAVSSLCSRAILLEEGRLAATGTPPEVISRYLDRRGGERSPETRFPADPARPGRIRRVAVTAGDGKLRDYFDVFEQVTVEVDYDINQELDGANLALICYRDGVELFTSFDVDRNPERLGTRSPGGYRARVRLPSPLKAGSYSIRIGIGIAKRGSVDSVEDAARFIVDENSADLSFRGYSRSRLGLIAADLDWETSPLPAPEPPAGPRK